MNSSTFLCSLGLLMVAGYSSAGGKDTENDLGFCDGPYKCAICPLTRERICVHPFANDEMIRQLCESEEKVHCISPRKDDFHSVALSEEEDKKFGSCPGPNKCVICPMTREAICVPPLANDVMIRMYCKSKDKIHCERPGMNNNFPYLDSAAMAVVENVQGSCPFLFFCKTCPNGAKICCPGDYMLQIMCCPGKPASTNQC